MSAGLQALYRAWKRGQGYGVNRCPACGDKETVLGGCLVAHEWVCGACFGGFIPVFMRRRVQLVGEASQLIRIRNKGDDQCQGKKERAARTGSSN